MTPRSVLVPLGGALALAAVLAARPAAAQAADAAPRRNALTINPLGIPFEYVSGEYERVASGSVTIGVGLSFLNFDEGSYTTGELKARYYPNAEAMRGFSVGLAAGVTRVGDDERTCDSMGCRDIGTSYETRPTLAVLVDYNWMLGKSKRFVVGTGLGATRLSAPDPDGAARRRPAHGGRLRAPSPRPPWSPP